MVIDPKILVPSAFAAVLVVILLIRLIAGRRQIRLTEDTVKNFVSLEETGVAIDAITISRDARLALVCLQDTAPVRLIRSFGDKLVMQALAQRDLDPSATNPDTIKILRQDISHPPAEFQFSDAGIAKEWRQRLGNFEERFPA